VQPAAKRQATHILTWDAADSRIHGLKLGIEVGQTSVGKCMARTRKLASQDANISRVLDDGGDCLRDLAFAVDKVRKHWA